MAGVKLSDLPADVRARIAPSKPRTTRQTVTGGPYRTRCTCGAEFTTIAAEDRHVAPGHTRFEVMT